MKKPQVLDLFCGEGGAAWGYHRAGFRVTGADINHPTNPRAVETFNSKLEPSGHKAYEKDWKEALDEFGAAADLIHASPPCQHYSGARGGRGEDEEKHPDLIYEVREALRKTGKPYVIENVKGARGHMIEPVMLCGCMFNLAVMHRTPRNPRDPDGTPRTLKIRFGEETRGNMGKGIERDCQGTPQEAPACRKYGDCGHGEPRPYRLRRERFFEAGGWVLPQREHSLKEHYMHPAIPITSGNPSSFYYVNGSVAIPLEVKRKIMGCEWMTGKGVAEAIPPAFTEHIGKQFLAERPVRAAAVPATPW